MRTGSSRSAPVDGSLLVQFASHGEIRDGLEVASTGSVCLLVLAIESGWTLSRTRIDTATAQSENAASAKMANRGISHRNLR